MSDVATARSVLWALAGQLEPVEGRVELELAEHEAVVTLRNRAARNAMTAAMMAQLADAVDALADWPGAVLLVRGEAGAFCSGGHLGQVRAGLMTPEAGRAMAGAMRVVLDALGALPVLSVAVLDGAAIGGGAELALSCDLRAASEHTVLHLAHTGLGVVPGWGATARLVARVGRGPALKHLLTAHPLTAREAWQAGLIDHVAETVAQAESELLSPIRRRDPDVVRAAKTQVLAAVAGDREAETEAFLAVWGAAAHQAALGSDRER